MRARACAPVVAAVDGRTGSVGALGYAVDEAVRRTETLHLVHVWPDHLPEHLNPATAADELQAEGQAVIHRAEATVRSLAPGLEITTDLVVGPRAAGILSAARGGRLLVVGRSSHHRVEGPLGGTTVALAARAECPVVVVPPSWTAAPPVGRILVGMKSRTHARELLSHAFDVAHERGARVVVITAWELYDPTVDRQEAGDHAAEWDAEGTRVLEDLVEEWRTRFPTVPVDLQVIHGSAAAVMEKASDDADLLLVARRLHALPPYGRLGSTAHTLLRTSRCPVQVVPAGVVADAPTTPTQGMRPI